MDNANVPSTGKMTVKVTLFLLPPHRFLVNWAAPGKSCSAACSSQSTGPGRASVTLTAIKLTNKHISLNKHLKNCDLTMKLIVKLWGVLTEFSQALPSNLFKEKASFSISSPRLHQKHLHRRAVASHFCWPKDCRPIFALYCTVLCCARQLEIVFWLQAD